MKYLSSDATPVPESAEPPLTRVVEPRAGTSGKIDTCWNTGWCLTGYFLIYWPRLLNVLTMAAFFQLRHFRRVSIWWREQFPLCFLFVMTEETASHTNHKTSLRGGEFLFFFSVEWQHICNEDWLTSYLSTKEFFAWNLDTVWLRFQHKDSDDFNMQNVLNGPFRSSPF